MAADKVTFRDLGEGRFRVEGALTFDTVADAVATTQKLFADYPALELDLSGVSASDSAGLALLIEWVRRAQRRDCRLSFSHVPEQVMAVARISDADKLLPVLS